MSKHYTLKEANETLEIVRKVRCHSACTEPQAHVSRDLALCGEEFLRISQSPSPALHPQRGAGVAIVSGDPSSLQT